jgi:hypothetical protein
VRNNGTATRNRASRSRLCPLRRLGSLGLNATANIAGKRLTSAPLASSIETHPMGQGITKISSIISSIGARLRQDVTDDRSPLANSARTPDAADPLVASHAAAVKHRRCFDVSASLPPSSPPSAVTTRLLRLALLDRPQTSPLRAKRCLIALWER